MSNTYNGSTVLVYNSIILDDINTQSFNQEPVWSEDKTDYLYTKFTITLKAVLNANLNPVMLGETTPTQICKRIRSCLMQPRKVLAFSVGGEVLLQSPRTGYPVDAANGPKPLFCKVTAIQGTQTFLVQFSIETHLNECCSATAGTPGQPNSNAYVSHRWTESQSLDERFYTTRKINGKIAIRSDALTNVSDLFYIAKGGSILPHFERRESSYNVASDGLSATYSFTDVEVYKVAPAPAVSWAGNCITSTSNGAMFISECTVTMIGGPTSSKNGMIAKAVTIAVNRLFPNAGGVLPNTGSIVAGYVREVLDENVIELKVRAMNAVLNQTIFSIINSGAFNNNLDIIRGVDALPQAENYVGTPGGLQRSGLPQGYITALSWIPKVLDDPCLGISQANYSNTVGTTTYNPDAVNTEDVQDIVPAIISTSSAPTTSADFDTEEISEGIYPDYFIETNYYTTHHKLMMPLSSTTSAQSTAFATMAQPTMIKVVDFMARKIGEQPTVPASEAIDPNNVLLGERVGTAAPEVMPDGQTLLWTISGTYTYGMVDAEEARYATGMLPYLDLDSTDQALIKSKFQPGMLETLQGDTGFV